jgi:cell division protein FtsN
MAKKNQAVRQDQRAPLPAWVWLVTGFTAGILLSAILIFRDWRNDNQKTTVPQPNANGQQTNAPKSVADLSQNGEAKPAEKPKYDFYNVLPEREVEIPDAELRARNAQPQVVEVENVRYYLQIGSFPGETEAEGMKAQLALAGVQAQMSKVEIKGKTWFRLRTGPFADSKALETEKTRLETNNVKAVAVREKIQ